VARMFIAIALNKKPTRSEKAFVDAFVGMLKEMPFKDIHVTEILLRSGYSRGSFYSLFEDKYDLANKIIEKEMECYIQYSLEYVAAMENFSDRTTLLAIITGYMQHIFENRMLYDCILDSKFPHMTLDDYAIKLMNKTRDYMSATLNREDREDGNHSYDDYYNYIEFYGSILHVKYWRLHSYRFTPEEMAEKILDGLSRQTYRFHVIQKSAQKTLALKKWGGGG
jgi:AcrR family transcriptional regulator